MLVLKRGAQQTIVILQDNKILARVMVTEIDRQGNFCQLGIEAPDSVKIWREEVYNRLPKETKNV